MVGQIAELSGYEYYQDSHLEGGWSWERHAQSQETLDKIRSDQWDVVILQEYSTRPAYDEATVCNQTVPYLDQLATAIRANNPETLIQFYLTWGRPYGEESLCESMEQFCSYETMQEALTARYSSFACLTKPARLAPVGEAFRSNGGVGGGWYHKVPVYISGGSSCWITTLMTPISTLCTCLETTTPV